MLLGKSEVLQWIEMNETPYWSIRRTEKSPIIFPSKNDDKLSVAESKEYLERVLNMMQPGTYFIEAHGEGKGRNNWYKTSFCTAGSSNTAGIAGTEISVEKIKKDIMNEMELDRLREENAELKKIIDSSDCTIVIIF